MQNNVHLLLTRSYATGNDVIYKRGVKFRVKVFCLDKGKFACDTNELQLYGYANDKLYAFETIQISAEDALDVVGAIQWYARYIDCPDMEILPEDPRVLRRAANDAW